MDEDAELAALRAMLSSGPRTNRQRPAALTPPSNPGPAGSLSTSVGGESETPNSAVRLLELLKDRDGLDEAQPMLEAELRQREQRLGADHPDTLLSVTCLAMLLQAKGELATARPYYERALKGFEAKYGPTARDTLISVNNLAVLLKAMGNLSEARPLYQRVLAGDEAQLGKTHPHTLDSIYNLARLYQAEKNMEEAIEAKNSILRNLKYSLAHAIKAYNDAIRVYEAKLLEFGIPADELGIEPLVTNTSTMPAGLVAA